MTLELFDVQCGFGGGAHGRPETVAASDCAAELSRLGIGGGLMRTVPGGLIADVAAANGALYGACAQHEGFVPCPILVPNTAGDLRPEAEQVGDAIEHGAGAVCLRPEADCWHAASWASNGLFEALTERRMPVFCLETYFTFDTLAELAGRYPDLPFILAGLQYRGGRTLVPFLETFPSVFLSIGSNYAVHRGVETLAARIGPERLLFGTGYPEADPGSALTLFTYSGLGGEAAAMVGSGNIERLMEGIQR